MSARELTDVMGELRACAVREYPRECCGVVVKEGGALVVRPLVNVSPTPTRAFLLSARDTMRLDDDEVVAVYHSHPDGLPLPSSEDRAFLRPGVALVVVAVNARAETAVATFR